LKNNERQLALYHGYRIKLEQLKSKYWNAGLKIKAVQQRKKKRRLYKKEVTACHLDWINAINSICAINVKELKN